MKKVYLILLWIWLANWAFAQQPFIFQGNYSSGQQTLNYPFIETGNSGNTSVGGTAKIELKANNSIRLLPGFSAGGFTNGGYFNARIDTSFKVVINNGEDLVLCAGTSDTIKTIVTGGRPGYRYLWTPSIGLSSDTIANPVIIADSTRKYILTIVDSNGRFCKDSIIITSVDFSFSSFVNTNYVFPNQVLTIGLDSIPGASYSWSPTNGLNNSSMANPTLTIGDNWNGIVQYELSAIDSFGCIFKDTVSLIVNTNSTNNGNLVNTSPNAVMDTLYDNYGHKLRISEIAINNELRSSPIPNQEAARSTLLCSSGYFNIYFEDGCGMEGNSVLEVERRNVICQLFQDLSNFIVSPLANSGNKANIWIRNINNLVSIAGGPIKGVGSSYYYLPQIPNNASGIADNALWQVLNSGMDPFTNLVAPIMYPPASDGGNYFHGFLAFDFSGNIEDLPNVPPGVNQWHTDLSSATGAGLYDLYSIALHEITHALGFISLIKADGLSSLESSLGLQNYFSRYDQFLQDHNGNFLLERTNNDCELYEFQFNSTLNPIDILSPGGCATGSDIYNTNCADALFYSGSTFQPVFTSECFSASSLSHFEDQCLTPAQNDLYFAMSNDVQTGDTYRKRYLKPEEKSVLCDLGYHVNTTFGNQINPSLNFINYGGNACEGLNVVGITDGMVNGTYQYIVQPQVASQSIQPWLNDYNATQFECLEVLIGNGTLSITTGTSFTYTPSATDIGFQLLRYIPVSSNGNRGNITYIYLYVQEGDCIVEPVCSNTFLNNESFESAYGCWNFANPGDGETIHSHLTCWYEYIGSPDLFSEGCNLGLGDYNTGTSTLCSNPATNTPLEGSDNNFVGIGAYNISSTFSYTEVFQTILNSPLIQGSSYTLRLFAKVNNGDDLTCHGTGLFGNIQIPLFLGYSENFQNPISQGFLIASGEFPQSIIQIGQGTIVPYTNDWVQIEISFTIPINQNNPNLVYNAFFVGIDLFQMNLGDQTYLFLDNISLQKENVEEVFLGFGSPIGCGSGLIPNLYDYIQVYSQDEAEPTGTFTSNDPGLIFNSDGTISYDPIAAGIGMHVINYNFYDINNCLISIPRPIYVEGDNFEIPITSSQTFACSNQTNLITLTAEPNLQDYLWSQGGNTTNVLTTIVNNTTTFQVTANRNGCTGHGSITINYYNAPISSITSSASSICNGAEVDLSGVGSSNTSCSWQIGSDLPFSSSCNVNVNPSQTTTYTFTAIDNNTSCQSSSNVTISVNDLDFADPGSDPTICSGNSVTFTATGGSTYTWSDSNDDFIAGGNTLTQTPLSSTTYNLVSYDGSGCIDSDIVSVTVNDLPTVSLTSSGPTTFCEGGSVTLTSSSASGYSWNTGAITQSIDVTTQGDYFVTVTDANGCSKTSDAITITLYQSPNANAGSDASICLGSSTQLNATGGASYSWSPATGLSATNIANPVANPTQTTDYTVTVTDGNGCSQTDIVTVTVNNLPTVTISPSGSTTFCQGGSVTLNASSGTSYSWNTGATTQSITVSTAGNYSVTVTDGNGCSTTSSTTSVSVNALPTANAGSDVTLCIGGQTTLSATGSGTYSWSPASGLSATTISNPIAQPLSTTTYTVSVTGANGCTASDAVVVTVDPSCCTADILANPNNPNPQNYTASLLLASSGTGITVAGGNTNASHYLNPQGNTLLISGTFMVNTDLIFDGIDITLAQNAIIIVNPGASLTIQNYSHLHACQTMWQGIQVKNGAYLEVKSGSLIEDAKTAVYMSNLTNSTSPAVKIENAFFNKNSIGVLVYNTQQLSTLPNFSPVSIKSTKFICQTTASVSSSMPTYTTLLSPYNSAKSYCGVAPLFGRNIQIGQGNWFENLEFGVYGIKSNVTVNEYNGFKHIRNNSTKCTKEWGFSAAIYVNGTEKYDDVVKVTVKPDNYFWDCCHGVYGENGVSVSVNNSNFEDISEIAITCILDHEGSFLANNNSLKNVDKVGMELLHNLGSHLEIKGNQINAGLSNAVHTEIGIHLVEALPSLSTQVEIMDNNQIYSCKRGISMSNAERNATIENNNITIPITSVIEGGEGIYLENSKKSKVDNNIVVGYSDQAWWNSGIRVESSPEAFVRCNIVENLGRGLFMGGWQNPLYMVANTMQNNHTGVLLNYGHVGNIGFHWGGLNLAYDNLWNQNFGTGIGGGPNHVVSYNVDASAFSVFYPSLETGPPLRPTPSDNLPPPYFFEMQTTPVSMTIDDLYSGYCNSLDEHLVSGGDIGNYKIMLLDTTVQPNFDSTYHWASNFTLIGMLNANDSIKNADTILSNFYTTAWNQNIGKLFRTIKCLGNKKEFNATLFGAYKDTLSAITPGNKPETDLVKVLGILVDHLADTAISLADSLINIGPDTFPPDNLWDFLNSDVLSTKLTSSQYATVKTIAEKCPYEYGPAVYIARSLAALNDSLGAIYTNSCEALMVDTTSFRMAAPQSQFSQNHDSKNRIYPNPTSNEIWLEYNLNEGEIGTLEINNSLGQTLLLEQGISGIGNKKLNVFSLIRGIYIVKFTINDSKCNYWKLIISSN